MAGMRYVAFGLGLLGLTGALNASNGYITALPSILHRASTEFRVCEDQALDPTAMQRLACARNISFADVRKLDLRIENMTFARRNNQIHLVQARKN